VARSMHDSCLARLRTDHKHGLPVRATCGRQCTRSSVSSEVGFQPWRGSCVAGPSFSAEAFSRPPLRLWAFGDGHSSVMLEEKGRAAINPGTFVILRFWV